MNKFKIFIAILLILWSIWNIVDLFSSAISGYDFLFGQVIIFFIYIIPALIILTALSFSLKKSEIYWQKVLGNIGILVVMVDLVANIVAFIWNFIR